MLGSYAGSPLPRTDPAKALGRPAGKVEDLGDETGMTGSLEVADRPGRPRTRDPEGQHWDLRSESLVRDVVVLSDGLAGACDRLESVA
jgi:hypothetical protein